MAKATEGCCQSVSYLICLFQLRGVYPCPNLNLGPQCSPLAGHSSVLSMIFGCCYWYYSCGSIKRTWVGTISRVFVDWLKAGWSDSNKLFQRLSRLLTSIMLTLLQPSLPLHMNAASFNDENTTVCKGLNLLISSPSGAFHGSSDGGIAVVKWALQTKQ